MDAYEATRIVFSRIQKLDHENAAKIMGLLLIQDHGEKEMIRLAFGPEALLHSLVLRSQKELGLLPSSSPATPSSTKGQNSAPFLPFLFNEGGNAALRAKSSELYYTDASGAFGWRPCLYFARGFCKNGNACRFLHDDAAAEYKSAKIPYSPTSASAKYWNFLLQNQTDGQRAAAALMLSGGDEVPKFMGRARSDFLGISNAGSRQIYLTFPADSTFREEDVSNYFSIYGPVQDVRIPYQQKRMFGFVTFLYPETVKLILAKGNPHFVCNARVLVKPYKEKGKVSEKKQQSERLDFPSSWSSPGIDSPLDIGGRMLYSNFCNGGIAAQETLLLRRRLEEQQQAELLQQAIEQQSRRFKLLDLKPTSFSATVSAKVSHPSTITASNSSFCKEISSPIGALEEESSSSSTVSSTEMQQLNNNVCNKEDSEEEPSKEDEDFLFCSSTEHNLPDSPFASPTKSSSFLPSDISFSAFSPLSSCFFQMPARFSSGHGAVGM